MKLYSVMIVNISTYKHNIVVQKKYTGFINVINVVCISNSMTSNHEALVYH